MWRDATAYSKDDKERKPRFIELVLTPHVKLMLVYNHPNYPDVWSFSAYPLLPIHSIGVIKYCNLDRAKHIALYELIAEVTVILELATPLLIEELDKLDKKEE